jgi:hypothetical protein
MLVQAGGVSRSLPAVWRTLCCDCVQGEAGFAKYCIFSGVLNLSKRIGVFKTNGRKPTSHG